MRLPWGALLDPCLDLGDLLRLELFVRLRRRHDFIFVGRNQALEEAALVRLAFDHGGRFAVLGREESGFRVQPQPCLARSRIGAVAVKAGIGEDGADVLIELNRLGGCWTS